MKTVFHNDVLITDMSADGTVVVGNTVGAYETFRWTVEEGVRPQGRPTGSIGNPAGTPDVSDDGLKISATIGSADDIWHVSDTNA